MLPVPSCKAPLGSSHVIEKHMLSSIIESSSVSDFTDLTPTGAAFRINTCWWLVLSPDYRSSQTAKKLNVIICICVRIYVCMYVCIYVQTVQYMLSAPSSPTGDPRHQPWQDRVLSPGVTSLTGTRHYRLGDSVRSLTLTRIRSRTLLLYCQDFPQPHLCDTLLTLEAWSCTYWVDTASIGLIPQRLTADTRTPWLP